MFLLRRVPQSFAPYVSFAAFGVFWGTWGAALPSLREQAGVTTAELGAALLFIGAGALPAMALTGRLVDRFGPRASALLLAALAASGVSVGLLVRDLTTLMIGMALVGAASGAADVGINTVAAEVENSTDRPVLTRSHGLFSVFVVLSTLGAGGVLEVADGSGAMISFVIAGSALGLAALLVWGSEPNTASRSDGAASSAVPRVRPRQAALLALLTVGAVGAVAYAIENAYQSWGAVFVVDNYDLGPAVASVAPATFAAIAAVARLTLASLSRSHPAALLAGGGLLATVGSLVLAGSTSPLMAFAGIAAAALGTATLFPTLLSQVTRNVPAHRRGAVASLIATVAYLGFLLGPACMGLIAGAASLRVAFFGIAGAAVIFTLTAAWIVKRAGATLLHEQTVLSDASAPREHLSSASSPESRI